MEQNIEKKILTEAILCLNYGWKQHPNYEMDRKCCICTDSMKNKYVLETNCGHYYDHDCIMFSVVDFKSNKCPECQKPYKKVNL